MSNVNVVRTAAAGRIQTSQYFDRPTGMLPNSTLNQKFNIARDLDITASDRHAVRYVGIGNGGHGFVTGANGFPKWNAKHHEATHVAMYNQLPFVLRRADDDLPVEQRQKYRLRVLETHNGLEYVAYYLRVLDRSNTVVIQELRRTVDGVTTTTPYTPTLEDMNPVPPVLVAGEAVVSTGEYIASTCKVPFEMTRDDIQEFVDACRIIYQEDGYAVISEMASVAGVDRVTNGDFQGEQQPYTEAIRCEVTSYISTAFIAEYFADGFNMMIDIGNVEPLLKVSV
jgi:hypothetical protein